MVYVKALSLRHFCLDLLAEFSARSIKPKRAQHSVFFQGWILCNKRKQAGEIPACFSVLKDKNR